MRVAGAPDRIAAPLRRVRLEAVRELGKVADDEGRWRRLLAAEVARSEPDRCPEQLAVARGEPRLLEIDAKAAPAPAEGGGVVLPRLPAEGRDHVLDAGRERTRGAEHVRLEGRERRALDGAGVGGLRGR